MINQNDIAALIIRVSLGDRAAFHNLYHCTSPKIFGLLIYILKDRSEAEDALQEIFLKIWERSDKYVPARANAMSWMISIARNHAIDCLRASKRRREWLSLLGNQPEIMIDEVPTPEANAILHSQSDCINYCMQQMDPIRASAIRNAYLEGFSYKELAEKHDVPINTMRTWLRRGLIELRKCLSKLEA